jgi:exopolyphosphatase/guanosine-5'-triphosphate,3'-diphosphate pyrophosphatase
MKGFYMVKQAVIDIGTNSVRMLIAELKEGNINIINKSVLPTRLGEGVNSNGVLGKEPIERTIDAIKLLIQDASANNVDDIFCFATSAVRDAQNREFFIERVNKCCGIDVQVLSGEEEARAGFIGALIDLPYRDRELTLVDIGGGSTELVQGRGTHIQYAVSLNVGAVRLTEMFPLGYPINHDNWDAMSRYIQNMLKQEWKKDNRLPPLVGVGGTITSLAAMDQRLEVYSRKKIQGYCLELKAIEKVLNKILSCSPEERRKLPGLQPSRADIIPAGICILLKIMEFFNEESIVVSDHDNLEGMFILSNTNSIKNFKKGVDLLRNLL